MKRPSTGVLRAGLSRESQRDISGQILQRDIGTHHPFLKSSLIRLRATEEADEDIENEEEWEEGVSEENELPSVTTATRTSQAHKKVEFDEGKSEQQHEAEAHSNALENELAEEEEKVQEEEKQGNSRQGFADEESRTQSRIQRKVEGEKVAERKGHALAHKYIKVESPHYLPDWAKRTGNHKNKPISEEAKQTASTLLNQGPLRASRIMKKHNREHRKQPNNEETRGLYENNKDEITNRQNETETKEHKSENEEPGDTEKEKQGRTKYSAQQAHVKAEKSEDESDQRAEEKIEQEAFESKHRAAGKYFKKPPPPLLSGNFTGVPTNGVNLIPVPGQQVIPQPFSESLPLTPSIGKSGISMTSPVALLPAEAASKGSIIVPPVSAGSQSASVDAVSAPTSTDLILNSTIPIQKIPAPDFNAIPVLSSTVSSPDGVLGSPQHQVVLAVVPEEGEQQRLLAATAAAAQQGKPIEETVRDWSTGGVVVAVLLSLGVGLLVYIFYEKISRSITRMRRRYAEALKRRRKAREETNEAEQDEKGLLQHHEDAKSEKLESLLT